jgi:DNA-binding beta-propeller fold protein YncE
MMAPTGKNGGKEAAESGIDWLARASSDSVTEQHVATHGVTSGDEVGNKMWTPGKLSPTDGEINRVMNATGLGTGDIDYHVAYGYIALDAPREQNTVMYVGSDDAVKVWLNGVLVHNNPVDRGASDYQERFPVTLKQGKNTLFVAVYELWGGWSGFFGFKDDAAYSVLLPLTVHIGPAHRPPMYWVDTNTGTLHRLIGAKVEHLVPSVQNAVSLAVDTAGGKLYWAEKTSDRTGKIRRANLDGTNVQLVKDLTSVPIDIAIDTTNNKLYLTNAWGKVQRFNFNGSNFQSNLITNLDSPKNITVDIAGDKLYWTEQTDDTTGRIQRANLNGSNVELVKDLTSGPHDLAIDTVNGKLYVANSFGKIQQLNLDGSSFQSNFITGLDSPEGLAVDVAGGKLYWTEHGSIRRSDLNGENIQNVVTGLGTPTDLILETPPINARVQAAPAVVGPFLGETRLHPNYPNPFNPETWIPYQLAEPVDVALTIYDINGRVVRYIDLGHQRASIYQSKSRAAYWDGRNAQGEPVASGVYFYTLKAGDLSATRKMLIRK